MKKQTATLKKIRENIRSLIPYAGALLVAAGIIGLIFVQNPLGQNQDPRSEAVSSSKIAQEPSVSLELRSALKIGESSDIVVHLDSGDYAFRQINLVFNLLNDSLSTPEVTVNTGSGFKSEKVEVEQIQGGYLVSVVATVNEIAILPPTSDSALVLISVTPHQSGNLALNFDHDLNFVTNEGQTKTLQVPDTTQYTISGSGSSEEQLCYQSGGTWQQFSNSCADRCGESRTQGLACFDVITNSCNCGLNKCWNGSNCAGSTNQTPPPSPTPTPTPTPTPPIIQGCNESCSSNSQCEVNLRCYSSNGQSLCRLATNPTNTSCQPTSSSTTDNTNSTNLRTCNQYCVSNSECVSGLSCWNNFCRNPQNPADNQCAALTTTQAALTTQQCGQTCNSNADCAINLRCYYGECRLATNPSSTSCSTITQQTISDTYANKAQNATTPEELAESDTPTKKGDTTIPGEDLNILQPATSSADRIKPNTEFEANETILDLVKNLIANSDSKLPIFIILFGILLLVLSLLVSTISKIKSKNSTAGYHPKPVDISKIDIKTFDVKPNLENQQKD